MESLAEIQTRHRREQKDLQAKVSQKKKNATKKARKGINLECEELERQLCLRQEQERKTHDATLIQDGHAPSISHHPSEDNSLEKKSENMVSISRILNATSISGIVHSNDDGVPKKRNRQKERLARRAAETQAAIDEAEKEALIQPDVKAIERNKILDQITARGFSEKSIRPDGHCLFSAVADQLLHVGIPVGTGADYTQNEPEHITVRKTAAKYIEEHPDDFMAWLDEPLAQYVEKIRDTAEWGGHLELMALAKAYNVVMCVLQDGVPQIIEPPSDANSQPEKIWLAYYRHGFGLGEHYNSLRQAS